MSRTIKEIAIALGATVSGDPTIRVGSLAEPRSARVGQLALAMSPNYADALRETQAEAAVVWPGCDWTAFGLVAAIEVPRARLAMASLTSAMAPEEPIAAIDKSAIIAESATIGRDVSIGAFCVIGPDANIGHGSRIDSHCTIGKGVALGPSCILRDGVKIRPGSSLGARVVVQPGVVIGGDGFSFVTAAASNEERALKTMGRVPLDPPDDGTRHRIHSLGGVVIADDVEIGANATVDAGTIRATEIGAGTKIDNLVQVGHNVIIGRDCVLCAQAAVAGSTVLGDRVVMGGKSGAKDNIKIGSDVVLGGGAIVLNDVEDGAFVMGYPAQPMFVHRAQQRGLRRLPDILRELTKRH